LDTEFCRAAGHVRSVRGGDQRLRRDAACIDTRSPEAASLDNGDPLTRSRHPHRQEWSRLATSDNDRIKVCFHDWVTILTLLT
jgi:hypothetical protein